MVMVAVGGAGRVRDGAFPWPSRSPSSVIYSSLRLKMCSVGIAICGAFIVSEQSLRKQEPQRWQKPHESRQGS